jgi:hypothetical protein
MRAMAYGVSAWSEEYCVPFSSAFCCFLLLFVAFLLLFLAGLQRISTVLLTCIYSGIYSTRPFESGLQVSAPWPITVSRAEQSLSARPAAHVRSAVPLAQIGRICRAGLAAPRGGGPWGWAGLCCCCCPLFPSLSPLHAHPLVQSVNPLRRPPSPPPPPPFPPPPASRAWSAFPSSPGYLC